MDLEELNTSKEHEGQPLIHLIEVLEDPNSCATRANVSGPIQALLGLFFLMLKGWKVSNLFS
jgi:hypothetical protein